MYNLIAYVGIGILSSVVSVLIAKHITNKENMDDNYKTHPLLIIAMIVCLIVAVLAVPFVGATYELITKNTQASLGVAAGTTLAEILAGAAAGYSHVLKPRLEWCRDYMYVPDLMAKHDRQQQLKGKLRWLDRQIKKLGEGDDLEPLKKLQSEALSELAQLGVEIPKMRVDFWKKHAEDRRKQTIAKVTRETTAVVHPELANIESRDYPIATAQPVSEATQQVIQLGQGER